MESQEELLPDKVKEKKTINLEKDSLQYNSQDLDQEQRVDVNPFQLNTQNLHIHISNDRSDYSGKITGTTYLENTRGLLKNVEISLFFGAENRNPVYKTNSDNNGNFMIEDIPPGYYTIYAKYGDMFWYQSPYIKVLPYQVAHESILLKKNTPRSGY